MSIFFSFFFACFSVIVTGSRPIALDVKSGKYANSLNPLLNPFFFFLLTFAFNQRFIGIIGFIIVGGLNVGALIVGDFKLIGEKSVFNNDFNYDFKAGDVFNAGS